MSKIEKPFRLIVEASDREAFMEAIADATEFALAGHFYVDKFGAQGGFKLVQPRRMCACGHGVDVHLIAPGRLARCFDCASCVGFRDAQDKTDAPA